jgi:alanine racemase
MHSYIQISKSNILHNLSCFRQILGNSIAVSAVLKANAYGHGIEQIASILEESVDYLQVDDIEEFEQLRKISQKPTLVLGYVQVSDLPQIIELNGILSIFSIEQLRELNRLAGESNMVAKIHIPIDTGMGREGFLVTDLPPLLDALTNLENIDLEGTYSHFSSADEVESNQSTEQVDQFKLAKRIFEEYGFENLKTHISNTAGILTYEQKLRSNQIARIGAGIYGIYPSEGIKTLMNDQGLYLKPTLRWFSTIAMIKRLPAGYKVGYNGTFITSEPTKVALIPQGYSDGYDRGLSNQGEVLIQGKRCKVLGRISMNMLTVDISHLDNVEIEDEVVLLGVQDFDEITADEIATKLETISYEVIANINPLLPRVIA